MAGELELTAITIDGEPVPFEDVLASITIHHGRTEFFDEAQASTCQLTLLGVTSTQMRAFRLGGLLVVTATDGTTAAPRFTGRFTDGALAEDAFTGIAVGALRTLSGYTVGTADYPEESWSARVTRAFTDAGIASVLELAVGAFNPTMIARLAEPIKLDAYLAELTSAVQAAIADRPDGKILVQAIGSRTLASAYPLDPAEVRYAPTWTQRLPGANIVTVRYGDELSVTATDTASVALYGPIAVDYETTLKNSADATTMAQNRLQRDAYSHWNIYSAPLLVGRRLAIGQPLTLTDMPAASPYDPWTPTLEGWTDQIESDGTDLTWTMELSLSDPLLSGLTLPWEGVPLTAEYHWNTINPTTEWRDALTLGSLL